MFDQKAATGMQMDQAQAAADGARVGVQQAEVALNMARKIAGRRHRALAHRRAW